MGLLNFWKKKALEQPTPPYAGAETLSTDLPSIDSGSFDGSSVQEFNGMQQLPPLDDQGKIGEPKSISFNVPSFDFSMPPSDDALADSLASAQTAVPTTSKSELSEFGLPIPNDTANVIPPMSQTGNATSANKDYLDVEDLNKLFISDEWKEPDWNTFDPYPEEKIEEPKPEDFKGAELPAFDESGSTSGSAQAFDNEPVLEPQVPFTLESNRSGQMPVELFIRGRAYNRVFIELDQMNKTLTKIDAQVSGYEDMLKREEPFLIAAKDQMEYLYKRLNQIDKKIFAQ